jgi:hypothetical protein
MGSLGSIDVDDKDNTVKVIKEDKRKEEKKE